MVIIIGVRSLTGGEYPGLHNFVYKYKCMVVALVVVVVSAIERLVVALVVVVSAIERL